MLLSSDWTFVLCALFSCSFIKSFLSLFHRGMMDEEGNQFVAYFLPHEETLRKRKRDVEESMDYMPDDLYVNFFFFIFKV